MESKTNPFLFASLMNGGGDQTLLRLTLATAVAIFVAAFLLGLCCGWMRRRQQTRLQAAADLKRRARA
jgi:predicted permease